MKANGLEKIDLILGKSHADNDKLLKHMKGNKTDVALKLFDSDEQIDIPEYIASAVS